MNVLEITGLNEQRVEKVVSGLADLLANFQVYYTNLRNFHWNIKGKSFFVMHSKYEEMYNEAAVVIDDIAERLLQLGAKPESKFSEYLKVAQIEEAGDVKRGREARELIFGYHKLLIAKEREVIAAAEEANDVVTADFLTGLLKGQEKLVWMLTAYATKHEKDACGCDNK